MTPHEIERKIDANQTNIKVKIQPLGTISGLRVKTPGFPKEGVLKEAGCHFSPLGETSKYEVKIEIGENAHPFCYLKNSIWKHLVTNRLYVIEFAENKEKPLIPITHYNVDDIPDEAQVYLISKSFPKGIKVKVVETFSTPLFAHEDDCYSEVTIKDALGEKEVFRQYYISDKEFWQKVDRPGGLISNTESNEYYLKYEALEDNSQPTPYVSTSGNNDKLTFGEAIEALQEGKLVQREGWNGKNMFLFMRPSDKLSVGFIQNVKSLPESVKQYFKDNFKQEDFIHFGEYICMKAADNSIVNGWLASQTDMLVQDWRILETKEEPF